MSDLDSVPDAGIEAMTHQSNDEGTLSQDQLAALRKVETRIDLLQDDLKTSGRESKDFPTQIGRYRVTGQIAAGSFGSVLRARDEDLDRDVAIKVPHAELLASEKALEAFLAEARILASLDHPGIVPVYDVGCTEEGLYFLVTKLVEGADLKTRLKRSGLSPSEAVAIAASVAEALHCAHRRGLVHRDVKPANILLDPSGRPMLIDFGLALKEENLGSGPMTVGTPAYMSPEQARGEGHRVDGRSDIFSLGVVFYELLVGQRPFKADSQQELLEQIANVEARPPRQIDDQFPGELERICLKALSKRASERYTTAKDMADDLRHFLAVAPAALSRPAAPADTSTPVTPPLSDQRTLKIVPKGLRSFDAHEADFFLELLPGPRDRDGLPESIRFWKSRIEETDAEQTFSVGLLYGPTGCGKSSLVKAGLLPRLSEDVIAVYLEATAEETETRLLNGLRKRCPGLSASLGLKESLAALRRGCGIPWGKKVVIVLDQFEQWLHAKKEELNAELTQALRQCDGSNLQCVVMVRDDFWMAATRFMRELEIHLLEGQNSAVVDLFPIRHAEKVLSAFGRAFGVLPDATNNIGEKQQQFIEQAVAGLAEEGKVISVRLALFAEMFKDKAWTPAALKEVGGTAGVGVTFLEETFSAATALPERRYHQQAARNVLKALLPGSGVNMKGHMQSYGQLLDAAGLGNRPKDFEDLIRILDSEIRLITPTDPQGKKESSASLKVDERYYQLTHDYLVPSIRRWLTRKQRETRRGRAQLCLAERTDEWTLQKGTRLLPGWREWVGILLWVPRSQWNPAQRTMMQAANHYYALRSGGWFLLILFLGLAAAWLRNAIVEERNQTQADRLVESITNFHGGRLSELRAQVQQYSRLTVPKLRAWIADPATDSDDRIHARIVLLPLDSEQVQPLMEAMLDEDPEDLLEIRGALEPYRHELIPELWRRFADRTTEPGARLRAAAALAAFDPEDPRWTGAGPEVFAFLVEENLAFLKTWLDAFRPVRAALLPPLKKAFHDEQHPGQQLLATEILTEYAADDARVLVDLAVSVNVLRGSPGPRQYARLWSALLPHRAQVIARLEQEARLGDPVGKHPLDKRRAQALVTLLKLGRPEQAWPLLRHGVDPTLRSFMIHLLAPLSVDPQILMDRYVVESDVSARRALLLSLGEFDEVQLPRSERRSLAQRLLPGYRTDADPGLHAAIEWLLRRWGLGDELQQVHRQLAQQGTRNMAPWFVNGQGQTMVALAAPGEYWMGSPLRERGRGPTEIRHRQVLVHCFAIASTKVTVEQFQRFVKANPQIKYLASEEYSPHPECPAGNVNWFQAAQYCRWLSEQEHIPEEQMCFPPIRDIKDGMKLPRDYQVRTGYRLPTEAEWEYACRAEAETSRYYGESEELLGRYAWYLASAQGQSWPVRLLKPNDFGLFDMHGNMWDWCADAYHPERVPGTDSALSITLGQEQVLRGGSFRQRAAVIRSAQRTGYFPIRSMDYGVGMRVVRTMR